MREDFRVVLNTLSGDFKREIHDLKEMFMGEVKKLRDEFGEEISNIHKTVEDLKAMWCYASDPWRMGLAKLVIMIRR